MNTEERLKNATKRAIEVYTHVGYLSTNFSGLEETLLKLTAKLVSPENPEQEEKILSNLSFTQMVEKFKQNVKKLLSDPEAIMEAEALAKRLLEAAAERNDIIHSSWIAYTIGDYGQHRARIKKQKLLPTHVHQKSPVDHINKITDDVYGLIFDLACFEDRIKK